MKKIICFVLCITTMFGLLSVSAFAASSQDSGIMPCYNNVGLTQSIFCIDPDGLAHVSVSYDGYSGITTGATITIRLQKKVLGLFWSTVDIGEPDDMWIDHASGYLYHNSHSYQLTDKGTYRAEINYTIYGTAGPADEVEDLMTYKYS